MNDPLPGSAHVSGSATQSVEPIITVIVPTFNRAKNFLPQALDSVLAQNFTDYAVIVSDNASTDDTPQVVERFSDPRITYIRRLENVGWLRNFNAALSIVKTKYVTILNDDDLMRPGALERAVIALEANPTVGLLHTALDSIGPAGGLLASNVNWTHGLRDDTFEPGQLFIRRSMRYLGRVCPPSAVMRTNALPDPPYDPEDDMNSDHILHLSIALDWDVLYLRTAGMQWRGHVGQDSASMIYVTPDGAQALHLEAIWRMREVKLRFIRSNADRLRYSWFLRMQVVRFVNYELVDRSIAAIGDGRGAALREFGQGVRLSPTVVLEPRAWRFLLRTLLGGQLWRGLKRAVGRRSISGG